MPTNKRRDTDDAWNKNRLGKVRERVEGLKAAMNAHSHIPSAIVFDAGVAALHNAAEAMNHEALKHREFYARSKKVAGKNTAAALPPGPTTDAKTTLQPSPEPATTTAVSTTTSTTAPVPSPTP